MAFLGRWLVRLGRHRRLAPLRRYARQTGLFEWYLPFERYLLLGQAADSGDPDIMLFVDEPTLSGAMLPPDVQDDLAIMGWALGMSPIEAVTVDVDGVPMGAAFLGLPFAPGGNWRSHRGWERPSYLSEYCGHQHADLSNEGLTINAAPP